MSPDLKVPMPIKAVLLFITLICGPPAVSGQLSRNTDEARASYDIKLEVDIKNLSYTGTQRVRWTNGDDRSVSVLYFHLYSNLRTPARSSTKSASELTVPDEPLLDVTQVRLAKNDSLLPFLLDNQGTTLRVILREPVAPGRSVEVEIDFRGAVPQIDKEETGLFAHLIQQVGAVLRKEREVRRARDVNFSCSGIMLIGNAYPLLAARDGDDWQRKVEQTVSDPTFTEVADYKVSVTTTEPASVFASGRQVRDAGETTYFEGKSLRNFAIVVADEVRLEQRQVGDITIRSVFLPQHERVGRRVLAVAADAARVFSKRFGSLPTKEITLVEAPLVAGLGRANFASLSAIASAFYVDFDSPTMRNLPEIVREQRQSLEESLEFTVAHVIAHQWWGAAVGNDRQREPVLDEALANWSALRYYQDIHGEERGSMILEDQLRGVYRFYRTFGGQDLEADKPARDYMNFFQFSAIVASKGALMLEELRKILGDERFFTAIANYYKANRLDIAHVEDLRAAFIAEAPVAQRRVIGRTFSRWLSSKRGDEDIAEPDPELAASLGLALGQSQSKASDGNTFARLGKFFWQQITRLR